MSLSTDGIPTLQETLNLWNRKQELESSIEQMKMEQVGLRASVDYLKNAELKLRISLANLCYDMSNILEIAGRLADNDKTDMWQNLPKP